MKKLYSFLPFIIFILCSTMFCANVSYAAIGEYSIVCGTTSRGQDQMCNMGTHKCLRCETHTTPWLLRWAADHVKYEFSCVNANTKTPRSCSIANGGGREGASYTRVLAWKVSEDEGNECVTSNFVAMYTSACYSCEIVETLASAFVRAAAKAYDVAKEAGNAILVVGMILWIGIYVLKNISSFTTVEPRQMIQGLLVQLFKIMLAFIIVNSGLPTILHYTMEPLMMFGTDFATAILMSNAPPGGL